jgi:glutathione S-transferase
MPTLRLLGTTTSPYTRKIRILTAAARLPFELVDTRTDEGAALLQRVSPLGKVPVLLVGEAGDAEVLPDSGLIAHWLWARDQAPLREAGFVLDQEAWEERAMQVAVEGALDAAINRFYLLRDGFADNGYLVRQRERVDAVLGWLELRATFRRPCTLSSLSLGCALDWMAFRKVIDLGRWPGLVGFRDIWAGSGLGAGTEPG